MAAASIACFFATILYLFAWAFDKKSSYDARLLAIFVFLALFISLTLQEVKQLRETIKQNDVVVQSQQNQIE